MSDAKSKSKGKSKGKPFAVEQSAQWYTLVDDLDASASPGKPPTAAQVTEFLGRAELLHADVLKAHSDVGTDSSTSDGAFLHKILQGGTLSDRLSALTLLVQGSPLHNVKALETLKTLAERGRGKGGRDESLKAVRAISDWWVGGGAPARKLKYFRDQPLLHPQVTNRHLVVWYFEDWLKKYFFSILQILETFSLDPLAYVRTQTITFLFTLLKERPEQEHNLLRLLVNKLGDGERTICSRVSYYLLQLLQAHPSMKGIVVREMTALVFKPTASSSASATQATSSKHIRFDDAKPKAKPKVPEKPATAPANSHAAYYATITFNQIVLSPSPADKTVARQLIDVYFTFFRDLLGVMERTEGREEERDVAVDEEEGEMKGKGRGKGKGKSGPRKAIKGQDASGFLEVEDSNSRHVSAILTGVNRALPFAKLTTDDVAFSKHVDTLFLISHQSTFNISLQALLLLYQITLSSPQSQTATPITDRYYRTLYTSLHDPRLATSNKQAMYLNLLFKSAKSDPNPDRVAAFVRRFLQVLASGGGGGPEVTAGGLYLVGELFSTVKGLRQLVTSPVMTGEDEYDAKKRDPSYAHAMSLPLWELTPLLHHYHPAVALHARQLLTSQPLTAAPDLSLNTLSHFLDRFIYKNPKNPKPKGASAMQPSAASHAAGSAEGVRRIRGEVADSEGLMNDPKFLRRRAEDVPVDQLFFHKYFTRRKEREDARGGKRKYADSDSGDDEGTIEELSDEGDALSDDAEEAEIWKAMQATMPKVAGDDDLLDADPVDIDDDDSQDGGFDFGADDTDPASDVPSSEGEGGSDNDEVEQDTTGQDAGADDEEQDDDEADEDEFNLAEDSDAEDLLDLDAEVPLGLISFNGAASDEEVEEEEWGGVDPKSKKRSANGDRRAAKRRKLRSLPTFASAEDYAAMIDAEPEDNL